MDRLADLFSRHRFPLACAVTAVTALCVFGLTRVTFDNDPLKLLQSDKFAFKQLDGEFAQLEGINLVLVEGDDLLGPEGVRAVRQIADRAAEVPGVAAVYSMLNLRDNRRVGRYLLPFFPSPNADAERFQRVRERAASHPLLLGHFLSPDRKTALVIVQFTPQVWAGGHERLRQTLDQLRQVLDACSADSPFRARLTGMPALQVEIVESMRRDIFLFSTLGAALAVLIAVLLFRRLAGAVLVASGPTVGTVWTVGTLGLIGEPINMLTNVVPVLVLVIGFTDSMHLVLHVRRLVTEGKSTREAATSAIRRLGLACALTSLSTAVGFGSLCVASLRGIQTFGWCCAMGSILSFFAVITVVPLLASTRLGKSIVLAQPAGSENPIRTCSARLLGGILARPRTVLAGGIPLMLLLLSFTLRLEPDHTLATEIPHSNPVYRALEHVDEHFGGVMFAYVVVRWPEPYGLGSERLYEVLGEVRRILENSPVLSNPLSVLNLVRSLPGGDQSPLRGAAELRYVPEEQIQRLVSPSSRRAVVSAHMPDVGARRLKPAFEEVEHQLRELGQRYPGFHFELTGASAAVFRSIHLMIEDLWKSLATAACVMFVMIWIGMRSLRYALASVLPNGFPLLFTGAFIVLSGRYLEMSSVIVFSISLGIAVDDTIHFLVRFQREYRSGATAEEAVRRTFHVVGTALVMTTVALVAGHVIVMISAFPTVRVFGLLAAVTIASALIGDLVILPALIVSFIRWWQSRRARHVASRSDPVPVP